MYSFVMRGELTKVAFNASGIVSKQSSSESLVQDYIKSLSLDLLDDECVNSAKEMATVYTAIAAFENMVRKFVVKVLLEHKGENWRDECVSDKIKKFSSFRHTLYFFRHGVTANPEIVYFFWKHIRVPNTLLSF